MLSLVNSVWADWTNSDHLFSVAHRWDSVCWHCSLEEDCAWAKLPSFYCGFGHLSATHKLLKTSFQRHAGSWLVCTVCDWCRSPEWIMWGFLKWLISCCLIQLFSCSCASLMKSTRCRKASSDIVYKEREAGSFQSDLPGFLQTCKNQLFIQKCSSQVLLISRFQQQTCSSLMLVMQVIIESFTLFQLFKYELQSWGAFLCFQCWRAALLVGSRAAVTHPLISPLGDQ